MILISRSGSCWQSARVCQSVCRTAFSLSHAFDALYCVLSDPSGCLSLLLVSPLCFHSLTFLSCSNCYSHFWGFWSILFESHFVLFLSIFFVFVLEFPFIYFFLRISFMSTVSTSSPPTPSFYSLLAPSLYPTTAYQVHDLFFYNYCYMCIYIHTHTDRHSYNLLTQFSVVHICACMYLGMPTWDWRTYERGLIPLSTAIGCKELLL